MRQTILLADDSSTIQRLVTQTFADTRFDVISVNNGDAAIRKLEEIRPDLVLADIYMPGKNGFEVCAFIKAHPTLANVPVVLLVGAFDPFDEATGEQAGAVAHITKPFEPRALVDLVKSILSGTVESAEPRTQPKPQPQPKTAKRDKQRAQTVEVAVEEIPATDAVIAVNDPADSADLLGLQDLFQPDVVTVTTQVSGPLTEDEVDRIVDRVIHKLSTQVVESIAWDVVPDIATRILRDELKRTTHDG